MRNRIVCGAAWGCLLVGATAARLCASSNLVVNGSFDWPEDPLKGWTYDYRVFENSWYKNNHEHVSVVPSDGAKKNVLKLSGTRQIFWGDGQGVQVDSKPIPYEYGSQYKLTVSARTTEGPNCRIYIEGYKWRPGVKPHPEPELSELRRNYKQGAGHLIYFTDRKEGPFGNVKKTWSTASTQFPGRDLTEDAMGALKQVQFISVHIIAIDGTDGDLLVDDVSLEKVNDRSGGAGAAKLQPGGARTARPAARHLGSKDE